MRRYERNLTQLGLVIRVSGFVWDDYGQSNPPVSCRAEQSQFMRARSYDSAVIFQSLFNVCPSMTYLSPTISEPHNNEGNQLRFRDAGQLRMKVLSVRVSSTFQMPAVSLLFPHQASTVESSRVDAVVRVL